MKSSGYSGTPLARKLGIKPGFVVRLVDQPDYYFQLFTDLPENVSFKSVKKGTKNLVHYFTREIAALQDDIIDLRTEIFPSGSLWISWPKKAAKVETNVTEDLIRAIALKNGLVDVKVCAIDEIWSGLKLVVPLKERV
jgi:hypothetical protein